MKKLPEYQQEELDHALTYLKVVKRDGEMLSLSVALDDQFKEYLARAYAYRNERSFACMIYDDDTPAGMALYYDCDELRKKA